MQSAVEGMLEKIDRSHLRPMRRESFLCCAKCCESDSSNEELQRCVQSCQAKTAAVENMLSQELEGFQARIQRCAMSCSDKAQDQVPGDPSKHAPDLMARLQKEAEACANKCVDEHVKSLSKINDRVVAQIKRM